MKNLVVCIKDDGFWYPPFPKKGEIYEVEMAGKGIDGNGIWTDAIFYYLRGFDYVIPGGRSRVAFHSRAFRPVDDTYGEVVCKNLEQILELEKALA